MSNYFSLLGMEQKFDLDQEQLYKNYIKLQQLLHPDKLLHKSQAERLVGLEYAHNLNKAYKILNDDKLRAEYLLSLSKIIINMEENNNVQPNPIMLNEILELNEDATPEQIALLKQECWDDFNKNYAQGELINAAQAMIKLQYLNKIRLA